MNINRNFPQFSIGLITSINNMLSTNDVVSVTVKKGSNNTHNIYPSDIFDFEFWNKHPNEFPICRIYKDDISNNV